MLWLSLCLCLRLSLSHAAPPSPRQPGWVGVGAGDLSPAACLPSETPGVGADGAVSYGPPGPRHPPQCCCSVWAAGAPPHTTWPELRPLQTFPGPHPRGPHSSLRPMRGRPLPRLPFNSLGWRGPTEDPRAHTHPRPQVGWEVAQRLFHSPGGAPSTVPTGYPQQKRLRPALHSRPPSPPQQLLPAPPRCTQQGLNKCLRSKQAAGGRLVHLG